MAKVKFQPEGYHTITPYLICDGAAKAIEFYKKAFGATEVMRMASPDGSRVGHAEMQIGDSRFMLADEYPEMNAKSPKAYGGCPLGLYIYVEDCDKIVAQAVAAGARITRPVKDQFYGDRNGTVEDPFGYSWSIGTHKEDLTMDQIHQRAAEAMKQKG
jgi:PhnB protein